MNFGSQSDPSPPISGVSKGTGGFFGVLFMLLGLLFMGVGLYSATQTALADFTWIQVPAKILTSSVYSTRNSKGATTYKFDLLYRYEFKGASYTSDRIEASLVGGGFSSSEASATNWVAAHPAGSTTTAYVNPSDPTRAALDMRIGFLITLLMLFPLPHMLIGLNAVSAVLLGTATIERYKPFVVRFLYGWGLLALGMVFVTHSFDAPTVAMIAIYFAVLLAVRKCGVPQRASV
jgi:hypothetical protein